MAPPFSPEDARGFRDVPDELLAGRVAAQDREAFAELYDRYARRVYLLAAHILGPARAEDVVQDAFLTLWRRVHLYDSRRSAFAAWFMAVARHRVLDELRRRSLEQRVLAVEPVDQLLAETPDAALGVADAAALRERDDVLLRALATLPPEQRRAIVLAYFGGLTHVEIAAALGEPLGTVKKRLQLGLRKLHRALGGERPLSAAVRTAERKEA